MYKHQYITNKNIAVTIVMAIFFSCTNSTKAVRDFLAEKNLPIGIAKNAYHVYKDSGIVVSKLATPLMHDFSNREEHPYNEFPIGLKIVNFDKNGKDSVTIIGDYALSYNKTSVAEIRGNVVVKNHTDKATLMTDQLYWDQKEAYFFSEKKFVLTKLNDTVRGVGFESKENLKKVVFKNVGGNLEANENE